MIITPYILVIIAAIAKSVRDILSHDKYSISVFAYIIGPWRFFFNTPREMSRNKYKNRDDISRVPKFWLSTTLLVWTQDAFHFSEMIIRFCFFSMCAVFCLDNIYVFHVPLLWVVHSIVFHMFYHKILVK